MMVGIVFATLREAQPFLTQTASEAVATHPFELYRTTMAAAGPCEVIVSGMGKVAAAMAAAHLVTVRGVGVLISAGLCGRLQTDKPWSAGDLFRITSAVEGDCDRFGRGEIPLTCDPGWFRRLTAVRLVTCDRPVFDSARRSRLAAMGDLVDMEGAVVARVAQTYGVACAMLKGISDGADEKGRQELNRRIDRVSARVGAALLNELAESTIEGER